MISHLAVAAARHADINWTEVSAIGALAIGAFGAWTAGRGLHYQGKQQRRLTDELAKRADFAVTVALNPAVGDVEHADDDSALLRSTASAMNLRFQIGIRNIGTRAATHVTVNFLTAVQGAGDFYWTDVEGRRKEDESGPLTTGEELGPSYTTTRWLPRKIDRVARKVPTIGHATLEVNLPNDGRLDVYARAAATSDDLPDDVLERVKNFVVRIRRPGDQA